MTDTAGTGSNPYDAVAYPTAIFTQFHPDRLAARARLHGVAAADPATCRVLEVGCGDGMSLLAMAAAAPGARFVGFDLAPTVIGRGRRRSAAAGLHNVALEVRNLLDAARELDEQFDYIIAHGLYAWVAEPVRAALLELLGRLLAPTGLAFFSYNTLPGGYLRMAVRDVMRHFIPAGADPGTALGTARAVLRQFAEPQPGDGPGIAALRHQATRTLEQPDGLLFHDELTEEYHPQLHSAVCAAAERSGLIYLTDSGRGRLDDGFLPAEVTPGEDVQTQIVRIAQERDFAELRYFRRSLFVRAELDPRRELEPAAMRGLWVSSSCTPHEGGWRTTHGSEFSLNDTALKGALDRLAEPPSARVAVSELDLDDDRLRSLLHLYDLGAIDLHAGPAPFATSLPDRPVVSPLARAMLEEGLETVCTLNHSTVQIEDPAFRRFLAALDGSRDADPMQALAVESGFIDPSQWRQALEIALRQALIMQPRMTDPSAA